MENKEWMIEDDLGRMLREMPLEEPSAGFTDRVMAGLPEELQPAAAKKPFYLYLAYAALWILGGATVVAVLFYSDLPGLNFLQGRSFLSDMLLPSLSRSFGSFTTLFAKGSSTGTYFVIVTVSMGSLLLLDRVLNLLSRRQSAT
jgi:hypothetical protein